MLQFHRISNAISALNDEQGCMLRGQAIELNIAFDPNPPKGGGADAQTITSPRPSRTVVPKAALEATSKAAAASAASAPFQSSASSSSCIFFQPSFPARSWKLCIPLGAWIGLHFQRSVHWDEMRQNKWNPDAINLRNPPRISLAELAAVYTQMNPQAARELSGVLEEGLLAATHHIFPNAATRLTPPDPSKSASEQYWLYLQQIPSAQMQQPAWEPAMPLLAPSASVNQAAFSFALPAPQQMQLTFEQRLFVQQQQQQQQAQAMINAPWLYQQQQQQYFS